MQSEVAVKPKHLCAAVAMSCVVFLALAPSMRAQEAGAPKHAGVPQDWSQGQIVFTRQGLADHPEVMNREVRVLNQAAQRWAVPDFGVFGEANPLPTAPRKKRIHRDWNMSMGGRLTPNTFPIKYSIYPGLPPDCANDFAVFGLAVAGTPNTAVAPANLVGFNNLYSGTSPVGPCGSAPTVLFAYNITTVTGGRIRTSPIVSLDGTKLAFVESIPGIPAQAIFHILTWTPGGTIAAPVVPTMTSILFSPADDDFTSSPWIDYGADTVYVGADNGNIYQITGVFNGTPTLSGAPWPVTLVAGHLTPPVLDSTRGLLMVGGVNGRLYQVNTATGAVASVPVGSGFGSGIIAPPIVDVTNQTTFVVSSDDGSSGAVLDEFDTVLLGSPMSSASLGVGSFGGGTVIDLYQPTFDHNYYNDPATGFIHGCGTGAADTTPWHYSFAFTGRTMHTSPASSQQLLTSTTARCTGWTEFYNPNAGVAGSDFLFFGLTQDCLGVGPTFGCLEALSSDLTIPTASAQLDSGPRGIIVDNYSSQPQASSLYTTSAALNKAYKFTQNGLN